MDNSAKKTKDKSALCKLLAQWQLMDCNLWYFELSAGIWKFSGSLGNKRGSRAFITAVLASVKPELYHTVKKLLWNTFWSQVVNTTWILISWSYWLQTVTQKSYCLCTLYIIKTKVILEYIDILLVTNMQSKTCLALWVVTLFVLVSG